MRWIIGALIAVSGILAGGWAMQGEWLLAVSELLIAALWSLIFITWEPRA